MLENQDHIPFEIIGAPSSNGILIIGDHASNLVPVGIDLQIDEALLSQHVAIDIGVADVARMMVNDPKIFGILGNQSRLVVDLNRYPDEDAAIPATSDGNAIPGNDVSADERSDRLERFHNRYHSRVARLIAVYQPALLLSLHSFTPNLVSQPDVKRPWEIGVLYNDYEAASKLAIPIFEDNGLRVGDQLPYSGKQLNATMNRHGEANNIPYLGVEMRQDMVSDATGQERYAEILIKMCMNVTKALAS